MLCQRRRMWANIIPALGQRRVFDRLHDRKLNRDEWDTHGHRLTDLADTGKATCPYLFIGGDITRRV